MKLAKRSGDSVSWRPRRMSVQTAFWTRNDGSEVIENEYFQSKNALTDQPLSPGRFQMQRFRSFPLILWLFLLFVPAQAAHGADATSFDPTKVAVKAQGSGGVPVGTIIAWPVATNPEDMSNWLECNGQSISRSVFPELFALVGRRVPDLRGLFLRGHGSHTSTHYGTVTHKSAELG
ncbi:phage tail protein, partial [Desulfovibrio sp. ZJ200]|uniref:phage tail protein n=1 Tax=Desulfovibrio sp. ZJ200 TaxID=2709792 RepID=UPI0013EB56A4